MAIDLVMDGGNVVKCGDAVVMTDKVFVENKITSVMFTSGITMNNNKPYDVQSTLDAEVLRKRILLMYYYLARTI